jgi:hypothetical protein
MGRPLSPPLSTRELKAIQDQMTQLHQLFRGGAEDARLMRPTASTASLAWNRQPGVKYCYSRWLKVFYIPRDHGHAVDQGRCSNQGVPF